MRTLNWKRSHVTEHLCTCAPSLCAARPPFLLATFRRFIRLHASLPVSAPSASHPDAADRLLRSAAAGNVAETARYGALACHCPHFALAFALPPFLLATSRRFFVSASWVGWSAEDRTGNHAESLVRRARTRVEGTTDVLASLNFDTEQVIAGMRAVEIRITSAVPLADKARRR